MDLLLIGVKYLFSDYYAALLLIGGTFLGLVFGAIPGLTAALGVTLLLPFTYVMSPEHGIALLIGIYVGGISGGLYAATLINIPGTPAAIITTFDGYPMAKNGKPWEAISLGLFSSFFGGIFSTIMLVAIAPQLARVALMFGAWEYFAMGFLGLSVVTSMTSDNMIKGLISCVIGLTLALVGMDPVLGIKRFTFGMWQLTSGFPTLVVLMGIFAVGEALSQAQMLGLKAETVSIRVKGKYIPSLKYIISKFKAFVICALVGTWVGILPGVGQSTASLMAYNQLRSISKTPEKFGTGHDEGVIASEAANNACCGGALIPMMTLGVPGDLVTSILLGGLIVHGLQPGPLLFSRTPRVAAAVFAAYLFSVIIMYIFGLAFMNILIKLLMSPAKFLFPVILVMCVLGIYSTNNRLFDVWLMLFAGILGYILVHSGFPMPPLILGYILGPIIESNLRTAIIASKANFLELFLRPISSCLFIIAVLLLIWPFIKIISRKRTT